MINISSIIDNYKINLDPLRVHSIPLYYVSEFKSLIDSNIYKGDIEVFKTLVLEGDIYNHIQKNISSITSRDQAKEIFFKVFYSKTKSKFKEKQNLMALFPSVFSILESFKQFSHHLPWH